jgi:hypothetical protein
MPRGDPVPFDPAKPSPAYAGAPATAPRLRDPRLDVARGLGMFIILIAHIPENGWSSWIPARFGYSDAADLFVFCSGLASALAFGALFETRGWLIGAARILHRVWQVYWAHIGSFVVAVCLAASADAATGGRFYMDVRLNLAGFFADGGQNFVRLATLRLAPDYFDILPMYLALLAAIPLVMGLRRLSPALPFALVAGLWALAYVGGVNVSGRLGPEPGWYFNPLGWQLIFFAGFAFGRGWLPAPPVNAALAGACALFVLALAPVACGAALVCDGAGALSPALASLDAALHPLADKTHYGPLRLAHFLATAYLALAAAGPFGARLTGPVFALLRRVGQQTLAVFLASIPLSQAGGMALDAMGHGAAQTAFVNVAGLAALTGVAFVVGWFKSSPWRARAAARPTQASGA